MEGLCAITPNATAWRYSCVIICGIWNYLQAFCVVAGKAGSSSIIMGWWGDCVGVGGVVCFSYCIASTFCSCSSNLGELSDFIVWRRGERPLGYRFFVFLLFIFSRG